MESGEINHEPLDMIDKDDPVTCAVYAREKSTGYIRLRNIQINCQEREEDVAHGKPRQTQIIPLHYQI